MDEFCKIKKPCLSDKRKFISNMFFFWTYPLFGLGYNKELQYEDLPQCSKHDEAYRLSDQLQKEWDKELTKNKPSLAKAIWRAFGPSYMFGTLFIAGFEEFFVRIAQPFLLGGILDYFSGQLQNQTIGYLCIFGFLFCSLAYSTTHHPFFIISARHGMRVRVAVQKLIMEKLLVVSKSSLYDKNVGQIVNLISNDVNKFDECSFFLSYIILAPIQAVIISVILWKMVGFAYFVGAAVIILLVPIQALMGRAFGKVRRGIAFYTDQRIRLMNEIISGMKVIKMYSWERSFADMIADIRGKEVKKIQMACFLRGTNLALSFVAVRILLFALLITYLWLGNQLSAKIVFVTMALCNIFKFTLTFLFPTAIYNLAEALVSCDRIKQFLLLEEAKDAQFIDACTNGTLKPISEKSVEVNSLKVYWDLKSSQPCLDDVSFNLKSGELLTIVGPVGSGKTSLLLALLKEIHVKSGVRNINGKISYAAQESWTFNGTIRENIVFGKSFDGERYLKVLEATSLNRDTKILPHGDMTLVGERGVGLSGGQRARVSLARALYHKADIYLLDDPLSAVDAQVANHIFQKCCKEYLASKIVILVTHHLHFLKKSDKILLLNQGKSKQFNSFDELKNSSSDFMTILNVDKQTESQRSNDNIQRTYSALSSHSSTSESVEVDKPSNSANGPEIAEEGRASGSVKAKVYWIYIKAGAGVILAFLALFFNISSQVFFSASDIWLSRWSNKVSTRSLLEKNSTSINSFTLQPSKSLPNTTSEMLTDIDWRDRYNVIVYAGLIVGLFVTTLLRTSTFYYMCNRASINLHNTIFYRILRSPLSLFESNPVGRILNRFSRDLNIIDETLPSTVIDQLMNGFTALGVLIVIVIISWYMVIPAVIILCVVAFLRNLYIRTARDVKRLEAAGRSPIYSHIANTVEGLTTVRAFKEENMFRKKYVAHLNDHTACWYVYLCTSRCLGIWTDWAIFAYMLSTVFVLIYFSNLIPPGTAGLALTQVSLLTGMFQWLVRQSAELESQMTSVERIIEYTQLKTEADLIAAIRPPTTWPANGSIKFDNVSLTYPQCPTPSLNNINIEILSGEKIGVVGRTGAGKSSLLSCLFRLVEPQGCIKIDGLDITSIGLQDLRKKISIIPQDPVIFSGTIRSNLDPFKEHDDSDLWEVLHDVQLKKKVKEVKGDLNHEIREGGDNFSVGQRQLICLARALLRNNKVLVIDEATANVDLKTDQLIQKTIRSKFSHCTVITIAHRLNTVIDSDRILVMNAGKVVEFDAPHLLLQQNDSYFTKLVSNTGKNMSQKLFSLAEENYKNAKNKN